MVGVAGFEPAASWTRTMRDTKLRHTPIDYHIIMIIHQIVKSFFDEYRNQPSGRIILLRHGTVFYIMGVT